MARKNKRKLTDDQEFNIMKIVLDKFLWIGSIIMLFGLYTVVSIGDYKEGALYILSGIILLVLFTWILIKEFEFRK